LREQFSRQLRRVTRILQSGQRFEHGEFSRMFAKKGAEAHFIQILATIAVATDENPGLAGPLANIGHGPSSCSVDLPIVQPDLAGRARCREFQNERDDGNAALDQTIDG
jgi:hypothetical protein